MKRLLPPVALLAAAIAIWQIVVQARNVPDYLVPSPAEIAHAAGDSWRTMLPHVGTTALEAGLGLLLGAAIGGLIAALIAAVPQVRQSLYPLLVVSQTIPMVVLAPLLVLWFGYGIVPKVVVVALIVFFPVVVSTVAALTGVDRELIALVRSMGASRGQVLRTILVPAAIPAFFAGLRISSAYAVAGAVVGEWVGASSGLGIFIDRARTSFRVDRIFVAVAVIALLSMAIFWLVGLLARLASPWQYVESDQ